MLFNNTNMYFDYNANCPMNAGLWNYLSQYYLRPLNPSSPHSHGSNAKKLLEKARHSIIDFFNLDASKYDVIFTSSATEGNNMIIKSISKDMPIYVSSIEHSSVLKAAKAQTISVDVNGKIDLYELKKICNLPGQKMISIAYANGEIGVLQDMDSIKKICGDTNTLLHTDCTQAIGKAYVNLQDCDFITFSGHKIGAQVGIGVCVFLKNSISQMLYGGKQEFGMRAGTENVLGALGLEYMLRNFNTDEYVKHMLVLREKLEKFLLSKKDVEIIGKGVERLSNTVYFVSKKCKNEELLMLLDMNGCSVSSGSACLSGINNISHVVQALGYDKGGIRVSFGMENTVEEVDKLCEILNSIL